MKYLFCGISLLFQLIVSAQYNSLLWKISGNGLSKPSYLYGTMHTQDERVFAFGDSVMIVFATTKAYAMELDPKETLQMGLISKLMMGKEYSLKKMITEPEYKVLDSLIKKQTGFSVSLFDNVAPVLTLSLVQMAGMDLNESNSGKTEILDMFFYKLAKKSKKKIIGIETVDEQLSALNSLTYQEQADLLVQEIRSLDGGNESGQDAVRFYLNQNLDSLVIASQQEEMPEKFFKAMVTDRNIRMAERITEFVKQQSTFVAVGALHLPGADGVIALLRKGGFVVEMVQ